MNSSPNTNYHFREKFRELIEKEKIFLDPNLNLIDLAETLGTNRTYISQFLNNEMHCSFYDYVNTLRIEFAGELLKTSDDKIEFISVRSGFSSITTFRRIFLKHYGVTASAFRKKIR